MRFRKIYGTKDVYYQLARFHVIVYSKYLVPRSVVRSGLRFDNSPTDN